MVREITSTLIRFYSKTYDPPIMARSSYSPSHRHWWSLPLAYSPIKLHGSKTKLFVVRFIVYVSYISMCNFGIRVRVLYVLRYVGVVTPIVYRIIAVKIRGKTRCNHRRSSNPSSLTLVRYTLSRFY